MLPLLETMKQLLNAFPLCISSSLLFLLLQHLCPFFPPNWVGLIDFELVIGTMFNKESQATISSRGIFRLFVGKNSFCYTMATTCAGKEARL